MLGQRLEEGEKAGLAVPHESAHLDLKPVRVPLRLVEPRGSQEVTRHSHGPSPFALLSLAPARTAFAPPSRA